jgi:hypothetical protein
MSLVHEACALVAIGHVWFLGGNAAVVANGETRRAVTIFVLPLCSLVMLVLKKTAMRSSSTASKSGRLSLDLCS